MKELRRSLRLFFAREFERLGSARRLWHRRRTPPARLTYRRGRRDRAAAPAGASPRGATAAAGKRRVPRGRRNGSRRRALALAGSTTGSVAFHLLVAALLFWASASVAPPGPEREHVVTIRLRLPPRPRPAPVPPPVKRPAKPPPARREGTTQARPSVPASPLPEGAAGSGKADEGKASFRAPRSSALPLPIGVGKRPSPGRVSPPAGGPGLGNRGSGKGAALSRYGGSAQTETAVALGLAWLAAHQDSSGGWSADGFQRHCSGHVPCPGRGMEEFDVGVTALAALAFLGAGHLPGAPYGRRSAADGGGPGAKYARVLSGAVRYLLENQDPGGLYAMNGQHYMYNHALATFALSEACTVTGSKGIRESIQSAVTASAMAQQSAGGWDYTVEATDRNDLSITGWQIMALHAASAAGAEVPQGVIQRARFFLNRAVTPAGEGIYTNQGPETGRKGVNMTAVGLLSKLYLGASPSGLVLKRAAERILRAPPDADAFAAWDTTFQSYYYWYTATLALFHLGGEPWRAWNVFLLREMLPLQSRKDHERGSWPAESSWVGASGGRVYATATAVLTLETYYRYKPFHETRR